MDSLAFLATVPLSASSKQSGFLPEVLNIICGSIPSWVLLRDSSKNCDAHPDASVWNNKRTIKWQGRLNFYEVQRASNHRMLNRLGSRLVCLGLISANTVSLHWLRFSHSPTTVRRITRTSTGLPWRSTAPPTLPKEERVPWLQESFCLGMIIPRSLQ